MPKQERTVLSNLKLSDYGKDTDQFLIVHKFGHLEEAHEEDIRMMVEDYKETLHRDMNPRLNKKDDLIMKEKIGVSFFRNLKLYVESYMKRTDITEELQNNLRFVSMAKIKSQW